MHQSDACMYNSVETAQPGDRTTDPDIVMPERWGSSQRVDALARVVITPFRYTQHTQLHMENNDRDLQQTGKRLIISIGLASVPHLSTKLCPAPLWDPDQSKPSHHGRVED